VIQFERVAGGCIQNFQAVALRGTACGIELTNDTQGVTVRDGLIVDPRIGVALLQNTVSGLSAAPLQCQVDGTQIDQYTTMGIHIGINVLETEIHRVVITGANTGTTEDHAILNESSFGTNIRNCRFQNIKRGNGITVQADINSTLITGNRFWCQLNGALIFLVAGTGNYNLVKDNYRAAGDGSTSYVINSATGIKNVVADNYDGNA
jgi:hypothetical protein